MFVLLNLCTAPSGATPIIRRRCGKQILCKRSECSRTVKILFFIDPLIVRGSPDLRLSWMQFAVGLAAALEPDPGAWSARFRIVASEHLARRVASPYALRAPHDAASPALELPPGVICTVSRTALRDLTGNDAMRAAAVWYEQDDGEGGYERKAAGMAALMRATTRDFIPDVVITFSAAPFLRLAYPDSAVLTHESGMFSRPPFPPTFFFDPSGPQRRSLLRRQAGALCNLPVDDRVRMLTARLRRRYLDEILIPRSPFTHLEQGLRERFDSLWVLPLQGVGAVPMDAGMPFRDQFDYVCWVLDAVGPRVGVILTQHPAAPYLSAERARYFALNHSNAIVLSEEAAVSSSTHFLLGHADGIINLVSNTGMQSLLWRKKLVTVGDNQTTGFADAVSVDDLTEVARRPWDEGRDAALIWLLTRYYRTYPYLYDRAALTGFLERAVARRDGPFDLSYFEPIDDPEAAIDHFIAMARPEAM